MTFGPESPYFSTDDDLVEILQRVHGFKPEDAQWVKKMLEYHPDEAKKILAEEGYPNGFQTVMMLAAADVDKYSIIAGYWEKIGVDLSLNVKEALSIRHFLLPDSSRRSLPVLMAVIPGRRDGHSSNQVVRLTVQRLTTRWLMVPTNGLTLFTVTFQHGAKSSRRPSLTSFNWAGG